MVLFVRDLTEILFILCSGINIDLDVLEALSYSASFLFGEQVPLIIMKVVSNISYNYQEDFTGNLGNVSVSRSIICPSVIRVLFSTHRDPGPAVAG